MPIPKINISTSNYLSADGTLQSFNTANISRKIGNIDTQAGFGFNSSTSFISKNPTQYNFAAEASAKVKMNNDWNIKVRGRAIGDKVQGRIQVGKSIPLNENNSIYFAGHVSTTYKNSLPANKTEHWSSNTGGWIGYTHKFDKLAISTELQQNVNFKGKTDASSSMLNVILQYNF